MPFAINTYIRDKRKKERDIVGLYLNLPENALVLCADEKRQCQALERSQPTLPGSIMWRHGSSGFQFFLEVLQTINRLAKKGGK